MIMLFSSFVSRVRHVHTFYTRHTYKTRQNIGKNVHTHVYMCAWNDGKHLLLRDVHTSRVHLKIFSYTHPPHKQPDTNTILLLSYYYHYYKKVYFWERDRTITVHIRVYVFVLRETCTHVYGCCYKFFLVFPCSFNTLTHILHELCCVYFSYHIHTLFSTDSFPLPFWTYIHINIHLQDRVCSNHI